ncbi:glutathione S-transferase [Trinickia dabaoshanensis]|uniref:Glutathione S-transferase n=1 Tax=Trinickia dabaoshanensis TaxID=564714 RepID=A0A2N7VNK4_9BURK|nr:glutathione S-transferase [Trinickia dabaoshanensis]PMS18732.1 glutathione S-transferase [Trinickia dabaoshanensis]
MIQLHGIAFSNYYNKVKFVLLEHGIAFEEVRVMLPITDEATLACSPIGKVPFIRTEEGDLSESQAIVEYLAARYPEKGIFPADPFEAAKVRQLAAVLELHLELVARELYPQMLIGRMTSEETRTRVERTLARNFEGFKRIAKFAPYLRGETFTLADICGYASLPLIALATKTVLGRDLVQEAGIDWKSYVKRIEETHPAAQRIAADRKAETAALTSAAKRA